MSWSLLDDLLGLLAKVIKTYAMSLCDVNAIEFTKYDLIKYSHRAASYLLGLKNIILDKTVNDSSLGI